MSVYFHPNCAEVLVPIEQVHPYIRNPNSGDVDALVESIKINGFYLPCLVQKGTFVLIAGHTRLHALLELGATHIPVHELDIPDVGAARIRLGDNRTNRLGQDDPALLLEELQALQETELRLLGTGYPDDYVRMLESLAEGPLTFDDEEGAKQRSTHVCVCKSCGWRSDNKTTGETGEEIW